MGVNAFSLLLLYRIISADLGLRSLGVWSVVMATSAFARLADPGVGTALARYVALARNGQAKFSPNTYAIGGVLTNLAIYSLLSAAIYFPARLLLPHLLDDASLPVGRNLVPFSLITLTTGAVAVACAGGLVGQGKAYQKSFVNIGGSLVGLSIAAVLVRKFGLYAVAIGQTAQNLSIVAAAIFAFGANERSEGRRGIGRSSFRPGALRDLLGFGIKLQISNALSMAYEPLVKMLLAKTAGLPAVAVFEVAQRLVQQARQVMVVPAQALVPAFAREQLRGGGPHLAATYGAALTLNLGGSVILFGGIATLGPPFIHIATKVASPLLWPYLALLCFGWAVNTLTVPGYLLGVASGRVWWNAVGHALTLVITASAAILDFAAPFRVVLCATVGLAAGSLIAAAANCRAAGVPVLQFCMPKLPIAQPATAKAAD